MVGLFWAKSAYTGFGEAVERVRWQSSTQTLTSSDLLLSPPVHTLPAGLLFGASALFGSWCGRLVSLLRRSQEGGWDDMTPSFQLDPEISEPLSSVRGTALGVMFGGIIWAVIFWMTL